MNNPLSYNDPTGYSRLRSGWWRTPLAIGITVLTSGAASGLLASAQAANGLSIVFGSSSLACVASSFATQAFVTSVAGGALAGALVSGNLKGALKGGITASLTFGIGHGFDGMGGLRGGARTFAHSIVSGVSAEVDGGSFGHGFTSAVLSQEIGSNSFFQQGGTAGRIVSNAILQGSISELTGSKFANGAISAAFRVAFNELALDFEKTALDANKAKNKMDDFIKLNPGKPIPLSSEDFEAIMALAATDMEFYIGSNGILDEDFSEAIQTQKADTLFFLPPYQTSSFIIEGLPNNNGKGVIGSTVNYIGIGLFTAAAEKASASIGPMVLLWNSCQIAQGQAIGHNLRQISEGTTWANIGLKFYQDTPKREE